ncbi:MAG: polyprenyl synthetase family protein [Anaerolineae bacterium]
MDALRKAMDVYLPAIEEELRRAVTAPHPSVERFYAMMQYHMGWRDSALAPAQAPTGKRLRPLLCLLSCQAAGGDPVIALPAAVALDILHNFSLIHDDIEDHSATRRHRPTVWRLWGHPHAINVGDGMFALAYLVMGSLSERGVPAERAQRAQRAFQRACLTLTEGQFLDMYFEETFGISEEDYLRMIRGKTATLLAASAYIGGELAGISEETAGILHGFGDALGMMFQIQDDILGIWGEESVTGKPSGGDILQRKKSLPLVYAVRRLQEIGDAVALGRLREVYQVPEVPAEAVQEAVALLDAVDAKAYCEELAGRYQRQALGYLEQLAHVPHTNGEGISALREFTHYLMGRQS